jgi:simple sugar transport system permease protein
LAATAACVAAALWAVLGLVFRAGTPSGEALVTLFLNYVAALGLAYLVHGPLRDPASFGWPMSPPLPASVCPGLIFGGRLHSGLYVAIVATAATLFLLSFTRVGKELAIIGENRALGRSLGLRIHGLLAGAMVAGGALAGLAGYFEVAGVQHKLRPEIALGFGYSGFLVAWMSRQHPILLPLFALIVAGLISGAESLQISSGLPSATADIFQASLLLMLLLAQSLETWLRNRQAVRDALKG